MNFGTYNTPFSPSSLWNSIPVNPTFSSYQIPLPVGTYDPYVGSGAWSTGVFQAQPTDAAQTVYPPAGGHLWVADAEANYSSITIPHWPAATTGATGSDGHCDIIDEANNLIHSFTGLIYDTPNTRWTATQYTCAPLNGTGWATPSSYMQGARATGVPTCAGLVRAAEAIDGADHYMHALTMSLSNTALSPTTPGYVFPATSADSSYNTNTGQIPEGSLMMLPPSFNCAAIASTQLRKIARTLQIYGAYVVDRNTNTPFVIYVENGATFDINAGSNATNVKADLYTVSNALRQATTTTFIPGGTFTPTQNLNRLSLRGTWAKAAGAALGVYDVTRQAVVWPVGLGGVAQYNGSNRMFDYVAWAAPVIGSPYVFTAKCTGDAKIKFRVLNSSTQAIIADSGQLIDGQTFTFNWPTTGQYIMISAWSGDGTTESTVSGTVLRV